jgi:hypothetical protein
MHSVALTRAFVRAAEQAGMTEDEIEHCNRVQTQGGTLARKGT